MATLLAVTFGAGGCRPRAFSDAAPSVEALAREVLQALQSADKDRLEALALSEREFHEVVWPELPAARPERNLPADYLWNDLHSKSRAGLARTLAQWRGASAALIGLRFSGETTQYGTYLVHRRTLVTLRTPAGRGEEVRLFGSVIERGGRFKVFSYVVD